MVEGGEETCRQGPSGTSRASPLQLENMSKNQSCRQILMVGLHDANTVTLEHGYLQTNLRRGDKEPTPSRCYTTGHTAGASDRSRCCCSSAHAASTGVMRFDRVWKSLRDRSVVHISPLLDRWAAMVRDLLRHRDTRILRQQR